MSLIRTTAHSCQSARSNGHLFRYSPDTSRLGSVSFRRFRVWPSSGPNLPVFSHDSSRNRWHRQTARRQSDARCRQRPAIYTVERWTCWQSLFQGVWLDTRKASLFTCIDFRIVALYSVFWTVIDNNFGAGAAAVDYKTDSLLKRRTLSLLSWSLSCFGGCVRLEWRRARFCNNGKWW